MDGSYQTASRSDDLAYEAKPFRLMDLPPELMLQILKQAVVGDEDLATIFTHLWPSQRKLLTQPPVLCTCRLLRTEGLTMFYELNRFSMIGETPVLLTLAAWLQGIGRDNALRLRLFVRPRTKHYCWGDGHVMPDDDYTRGFLQVMRGMGLTVAPVEEEEIIDPWPCHRLSILTAD